MNIKTKKKIFDYLYFDLLERFERPCDFCEYFECEKNSLNSRKIIRKKYMWNDIDYKRCLQHIKLQLEELKEILRKEFYRYSHESCMICKTKIFKPDMKLHFETKKSPIGEFYEGEIISLCKKCNKNYKRRKKPLHEGFKKY